MGKSPHEKDAFDYFALNAAEMISSWHDDQWFKRWFQNFVEEIKEGKFALPTPHRERIRTVLDDFAKAGVPFKEKIAPNLRQQAEEFGFVFLAQRAKEKTEEERRKWFEPYKEAVQLLTHEDAPLPEEVQRMLKTILSPLETFDLGAMLRKRESHIQRLAKKKLLRQDRSDQNNSKSSASPQKHPGWDKLIYEGFKRLTTGRKKISEYKAHILLHRWFSAEYPRWYTAISPQTIRAKVRKRKKSNAVR